ncbi:MAG: TRAP transporter small permease [Rhodobacter sp.]|nr:TRAP transporter small permease [Paracoccaceae bacterium]MCC0075472.1 TRAP transporter small permease [Rhodobacter sp.]
MLLEKLDRAMKRMTRLLAYGGAVALLGCVAVTVVDVTKRNFFASSVFGAVEWVQLGIIWAAFLTIPLGFAHGSHIAVDVFLARARLGVRRIVDVANMLAAFLALGACLWWGFEQARHSFATNELTLTAGLPLWLFWLPIMVGTALSALSALVVALIKLAGTTPGTEA